ncbi:UDP-glycosyltransferase 74F2 [Eucalyptus grandis]|uniref:UDP-glycosyltransferase 74F2 n=1 Tax=Eucalyptus grandis TaxID=71139 RepID=UPI00192EC476|nr:UDP-glycosyltransferase 74F2 [Eucalyptus grandis]
MEDDKGCRGHVLLVPYPSQGHINPMLQFSKRLASKGLKATFATTVFIFNSMKADTSPLVGLDTISDGHDSGGFAEAESIHTYITRLEAAGSKTLSDLIVKYQSTDHPVDCIVYDSILPWALDVAKEFGLVGAPFFTQACAVNYIYYLVHHGHLRVPVESLPVCMPGLPPLELRDMPSFIYVAGSYPAYFEMVLHQFLNTDKADWVLVNTFYELEAEVVDTMSKLCPVSTIGPTIPSMYLDKRVEDDIEYGLNLFTLDKSTLITDWLRSKPPSSVVYVSFGSLSSLGRIQMEELAWGLKQSGFQFLWVVRASEEDKVPKHMLKLEADDGADHDEKSEKSLIVNWCPQLEVLSNEAIGCFFTHCGWNSTVEALSVGVPMVGMPQWTDQTTDAKLIQDVWEVGVRVRVDEDGVVRRGEIEGCIREVMDSERGKEMRRNARKWKALGREAMIEGGSSDKNIDAFVSKIKNRRA